MQEINLEIRYIEKGLSKNLKKVNLILLLNPVPLYGQDYKKQKGPETSDNSLLSLQNNFRKVPLLMIYYLANFDGAI